MKYLKKMDSTLRELYLQMLFEDTISIQFDFKKYLNFINTAIIFKNGKIINEDKNLLIDIPNNLINYCLDHKKQFIDFNKIKELMKVSKHFLNIKNKKGNELYFNIFDFNNDLDIIEFHRSLFNIQINDNLDQIIDIFKNKCMNIDGFFNFYNNKAICIINEKASNILLTIYHELSHFIQKVCNIRIVKDFKFNEDILEKNERFQKLKDLNVTYEKLNYYFSNIEFITHVNDLIIGLWNTYIEFYSNIDIFNFMKMIRHELRTNKDFINSKFFNYYKICNDGNIAPLIMFIASYYFNHKYQKIDDYLSKSLKQKEINNNKFRMYKNIKLNKTDKKYLKRIEFLEKIINNIE